MPRIACAEVPLFPLAARLRAEPELTQEATVVLHGRGQAARIVAATRSARRAGIRRGQSLTQARARLPKLIARGRDPVCEQAAREALLDAAATFSPRIEDGDDGIVYLDLDGLERHHPDELDLAHDIAHEVERLTGLPLRIGIAGSKLTARLAAGQPEPPTVVPAGDEAAFLAPLPLERLSAEAKVLNTLKRWGLRSVGELARIPAAQIVSRLGETGRHIHAIARGSDPRPLVPHPLPPVFREGMEMEWPLVALEPFLFIARTALERLIGRMQSHGLACARLELTLTLEPEGHHTRAITLPAPTRDIKTLLTLLRLDLEATPPGAPTVAFRLTAHPDRPRTAQLGLFGAADISPDKLATTIARLFAILGEGRVGAPEAPDGHRPERFALLPYTPPPPPPTEQPAPPNRGLLGIRVLRPALRLTVDGDHPPTAIQSLETEDSADGPRPRVQGRVKVASGPWNLEEGWWQEHPTDREYWDLELADGGLYRVYKDRLDDAWWADGVYD